MPLPGPPKPVVHVPYVDRIRATCKVLGLMDKKAEETLVTSAAMQAVFDSVLSGEVYRGSAYADDIQQYLGPGIGAQ